jgi:signal transduction histidine kinase/CheY-like chemotaxis protein
VLLAALSFALQAAPVLVLVATACAVAATYVAMRRVAAESARERAALQAENAELARALEDAADRAWELHETEERYRSLDAARERAEAASLAKSRFLAVVSHELRTPLNGILGLNSLLIETDLSPAQETYALGVQSSGAALLALIEDLLDFSKIEAGRLDIRPEPASVEDILGEVAALLAGRAHEKGIDLAVAVDPALPGVLRCDAARLRQVLVNLAGNAVKFTDAGGVTMSAAVAAATGGRVRVAFAVTDTGPGIPAADAERLFGEFEQADTAPTRRHGGAGLGLAISRRIVEAMGGRLAVAAGPGGGAVFDFAIELDVPASEPLSCPSLAGRRVLAVMPDGAEAVALSECLERAGAEVRAVAAFNAAAALAGAAAAAALPYHVVLLDGRIAARPEAALAGLRAAAGERLPVVMLIEPGDRSGVDDLRSAGFDGYLVRPVRRRSLVRLVADVASGEGAFRIDPHDADKPAAAPLRRSRAGLDVLVAEDDEISALLARAVIEAHGDNVTDVRDGDAAVAAATAPGAAYHIVFLDLHMPGLDGLEAAARIRAHERAAGRPRVPIVAMTADALPETRRATRAAGIDSELEKPVAPAALRALLSELAARVDAHHIPIR